jgi:hypothetical protein
MQLRSPILGTLIFFVLPIAYPAASQAQQDKTPQSRPAQGAQRPNPGAGNRPNPGAGNRPSPGGGNNNRPQPGRPNPGTPPPRPNPGAGKPQPGRPNPGNGNNRPQPGRPNPGNRPSPGRPTPGRPTPGRSNPGRPGGSRPPNWGRPPARRPSYSFRGNDRAYLHRYYLGRLGAINRLNRPRFIIGGFFPYAYISDLSPLPPDVYGYLPPPPPGYDMGYYDGYVVVYDPLTYFIANVIDLLD